MDKTIFVLLNMLLGEIGVFDEIVNLPDTPKLAGIIWFWGFLVLGFFLLLNVLLAIIVDSYGDMKGEQMDGATTILEDIQEIMHETLTQVKDRAKQGSNYMSNEDILTLLKSLSDGMRHKEDTRQRVVEVSATRATTPNFLTTLRTTLATAC